MKEKRKRNSYCPAGGRQELPKRCSINPCGPCWVTCTNFSNIGEFSSFPPALSLKRSLWPTFFSLPLLTQVHWTHYLTVVKRIFKNLSTGEFLREYAKPNVATFNIVIFIQFNPYSFNLISIFIQFSPYSFNLIPIVIQFNPYSFNSIFRSIQFNFYFGSIWFLYSFNSVSIFIQFNFYIHSIQSVFIHSILPLIYSILGSGSRENLSGELGPIVKMAAEMNGKKPVLISQNSYLAPRLRRIKQKELRAKIELQPG